MHCWQELQMDCVLQRKWSAWFSKTWAKQCNQLYHLGAGCISRSCPYCALKCVPRCVWLLECLENFVCWGSAQCWTRVWTEKLFLSSQFSSQLIQVSNASIHYWAQGIRKCGPHHSCSQHGEKVVNVFLSLDYNLCPLKVSLWTCLFASQTFPQLKWENLLSILSKIYSHLPGKGEDKWENCHGPSLYYLTNGYQGTTFLAWYEAYEVWSTGLGSSS